MFRDGGDRWELQAFASGGDDGAEALPGGCCATATGFDEAGEARKARDPSSEGVPWLMVREITQCRRAVRGVAGKRQLGLGDGTLDHLPVVEEFAHDAAQHRVLINRMRFAQVPRSLNRVWTFQEDIAKARNARCDAPGAVCAGKAAPLGPSRHPQRLMLRPSIVRTSWFAGRT